MPGIKRIAAVSVGLLSLLSCSAVSWSNQLKPASQSDGKIGLTLQTYLMPASVWNSFSTRNLATQNTLPERALSKLQSYRTNTVTAHTGNKVAAEVDTITYASITPAGTYRFDTNAQKLNDDMNRLYHGGSIIQLGQRTKLTPDVLSPKSVQVAVDITTSNLAQAGQNSSPFVTTAPGIPAADPISSFRASVSTVMHPGQANIVVKDISGDNVRVDILTFQVK